MKKRGTEKEFFRVLKSFYTLFYVWKRWGGWLGKIGLVGVLGILGDMWEYEGDLGLVEVKMEGGGSGFDVVGNP